MKKKHKYTLNETLRLREDQCWQTGLLNFWPARDLWPQKFASPMFCSPAPKVCQLNGGEHLAPRDSHLIKQVIN